MQQRMNTLATLLVAWLISTGAWATGATGGSARMERESLNPKHRHETDHLQGHREGTPPAGAGSGRGFQHVELHGLVEMEASHADGPGGGGGDLAAASVELVLNAQVTPWVGAHVLIALEGGTTTPPKFDEASITIANPEDSPLSIAMGRIRVPFGNFDSALISEPLTLEVGETQETAMRLGWGANGLHAFAYGPIGGAEGGGYGVALGYTPRAERGGGSTLSFAKKRYPPVKWP